ncbi:MAG: hypothetical protein HC822_26895 [Oscillochloris sp.]|nr:hypothetical protein [Oscillochloris sp.]
MDDDLTVRDNWQSPVDPIVRKTGTALLTLAAAFLAWGWLRRRSSHERTQLQPDTQTTPEDGQHLAERPIS